MIINKNEITLKDSQLPLSESVITAHTSQIRNDKTGSFKVVAQIGFFLNSEKMFESPSNALKVSGFEGNQQLIFDYPVTLINGVYVLDLYTFDSEVKAFILQKFPAFDADLLEITTTPIPAS